MTEMVHPAHKPTPQQKQMVETMAVAGITHEQIARVVGVNYKTLKKYYEKELDFGLAKANTQIATGLYEKALSGDPKAQMFWLERRGGDEWKPKQQLTFNPSDFTIDMNPNVELLDDDD